MFKIDTIQSQIVWADHFPKNVTLIQFGFIIVSAQLVTSIWIEEETILSTIALIAKLLVFYHNPSTRILGIIDHVRILGILAQKMKFLQNTQN